MKKLLIAAAAMSVVAGAQAQSTVTISGAMEVGAYNAIGQNTKTSLGQLGGSRSFIRFAATEDLGGGLKAGAMAEARFNPATGAQEYTNLFEQAKVFVSSATLGTVAAGKYTTTLGVAQGWVRPLGDDGALNADAAAANSRQAGQISWTSPTWNGVTLEVVQAYKNNNVIDGANQGSAGNTGLLVAATAAIPTENMKQYTATYVNGPLQAFYGYSNGFQTIASAGAAISGAYDNAQYGVAYDFGMVKLMASQQSEDTSATATKKTTSLAAEVPFGKYTFGIANRSNDVTDETRTSVNAQYAFSKRTKLMAQYTENKKNATATSNGSGTYFGVHHNF
jgi:predicted porin